MSKVAIIPARGGSKRIPRKNIREFRGKPVIAYSIELAKKSGLFDLVMVSTDDNEIAEIAGEFGAEVPFLRSEENSDDYATTADVLVEVLNDLENEGKNFETGCCIYPAAPLIKAEDLQIAYDLLKSNNYDTVFPVVKFGYPIYRSLKKNKEGKVEMNWPEYRDSRSQDLPEAYHDAGQFYWFRVKSFLNEPVLFGKNSGAIELNEMQVQDIDTEQDWRLAELKAKLNE